MGSGEAGGGVNVADLDGGAEGAGGVGDAAADGTVADDEDRSAVQGEAGDVEEGVAHEADEVAVVEPLFDGDGVPVEYRVGEAQVPDAVYACTRGSKPPRTLTSFPRSPPSGGRRAARRVAGVNSRSHSS